MIITKRTAQKWMKEGKAIVSRHAESGERLADATAWGMVDEHASRATVGERAYIIIDNIANQTTHHVEA